MPAWVLRLITRGRRVRWEMVWTAARWLYRAGRDRLERNLSKAERQELWGLMRQSRGRRRNLTDKEQDRLASLVRKALSR